MKWLSSVYFREIKKKQLASDSHAQTSAGTAGRGDDQPFPGSKSKEHGHREYTQKNEDNK